MDKQKIIEEVSTEEFAKVLSLSVLYDTHKTITLSTDNISRPGLQLAGYFDYFANDRVQVIGQTEYSYLETLSPATRRKHLEQMFKFGFPCLIFTRDLPVDDMVIDCGKKYGIPIFKTKENTTTCVSNIINYLNELLAPQEQLHGVLVDILGVGVLIMGDSGVGKSEAALELIKRGHRLCADDVVIVKRIKDDLYGSSPTLIRHFMEVRGIGIIDIAMLYGAGAVKVSQLIELVVFLEKWDETKEYERVGDIVHYHDILDIKLPKNTIPVTPGRNISIILETAAANVRMNKLGYNAAEEIQRRTTLMFNK